eukprot:11732654-Ditylum_brightwellii.AAC.1
MIAAALAGKIFLMLGLEVEGDEAEVEASDVVYFEQDEPRHVCTSRQHRLSWDSVACSAGVDFNVGIGAKVTPMPMISSLPSVAALRGLTWINLSEAPAGSRETPAELLVRPLACPSMDRQEY